MVIQNYRDIRARAAKTLSYTPWNVKKQVLIFGLVPLGLSLLLTCLDLLLNSLQSGSGIAGLQVYRVLSTASSSLWLAANIFNLFWSPGILYSALMILREQDPYPKGLLRGFRRWAPLLRYTVLLSLAAIALSIALVWFSSIITTPFVISVLESMPTTPTTESEIYAFLDAMPPEQMIRFMLPMLIVLFVLTLAILIPISYRLRLAELLILDEEQIGARQAIAFSLQLTKGSCWQLFRLDLSFWWYHLLTALCSAIPFLDILPIFSSWDPQVTILVLTAAHCVATMGVYMLGLMRITAANAVAYDHLRTPDATDAPQLTEGTL